LQSRLKAVDPTMLERLDASNPRRLARAIEVMEATGKSLRTWQEETPEPLVKEFTALWIQREKAELEARIAARVEAMFAAGWVEEVRGLVERYGVEAVKGFAGIGYGEIAEMLQSNGVAPTSAFPSSCGGQQTWERGRKAMSGSGRSPTLQDELKRNILVATRQYAKRQLTWFAREHKLTAVMLNGDNPFSEALRVAGAEHGSMPSLF
jgi:tRNA dimethylallyltransferase